MSSKYSISLDEELVKHLRALGSLPEAAVPAILDLAVDILADTGMVDAKVAYAAEAAGGIDSSDVEVVARSSAALLWEFAKAGTAEGATVAAVLAQLGLPANLGTAFAELYQRQRRVLQGKKDALSLPAPRYHNLAWRLDVELARRDMHVLAAPKFQLRLDLQQQSIAPTVAAAGGIDGAEEDAEAAAGGDAGAVSVHSVHVQADLAGLRRVQRELQAALDESAGVHYQRVSRYIT